ncbi:MAG: hypothetical protein IJF21_09035, partial [Clostridia bacterium]|nr:hypothetical protein [Clostridia bacterium]
MKEQDIFDAIGNVDPDMVAAADLNPHAKALKRRKFTVWAACIAIFSVFFSIWLFTPFSFEYKDISKYSESEYYDLMLKVQTLTCHPQNYKFKNNFEKYIMYNLYWVEEQSGEGVLTAATMMSGTPADKYEELTDNQFEGIIEGDLFKRSDKAIFYLDPLTLTLYSYSTEEAVQLDSINIPAEFGFSVDSVYYYNSVIYLS